MDQDWPITILDEQENHQNITLKPGEMLLYESARVPHGRPFPLVGNFYENIFAHFYPESWDSTIQSVLKDNNQMGSNPFAVKWKIQPENFDFKNIGRVKNVLDG